MTTTPATPLDSALEKVLRLLTSARDTTGEDTQLAGDLREVELTIYEVLEAAPEPDSVPGIASAHAALTAAEATLDRLSRDQRPLWLLPLRAELAILRRRSAA